MVLFLLFENSHRQTFRDSDKIDLHGLAGLFARTLQAAAALPEFLFLSEYNRNAPSAATPIKSISFRNHIKISSALLSGMMDEIKSRDRNCLQMLF